MALNPSSVMFLIGVGETLEDWTHKRSVDDLARQMALNVEQVWLVTCDSEVLTDSSAIAKGDKLVPYTLLGAGLTYAFSQNITKPYRF